MLSKLHKLFSSTSATRCKMKPAVCNLSFLLPLLILIYYSAILNASADASLDSDRCELLQIAMCRQLPYNRTLLPNLLGHSNQQMAAIELRRFQPLIKLRCSLQLQLFVCSLMAPVCSTLDTPIAPCRQLCESALANCEPHMHSFGIDWRSEFDCSKFPHFGGSELCIWQLNDLTALQSLRSNQLHFFASPDHNQTSYSHNSLHLNHTFHNHPLQNAFNSTSARLHFSCPAQLSTVGRSHSYRLPLPDNRIVPNCGFPCNQLPIPITVNQRNQLELILLFCSIITSMLAMFSLLTFAIDRTRFQYPEKQIVCSAFCQLGIALPLLFGQFMINLFNQPYGIACTAAKSVATESLIVSGTHSEHSSALCTLTNSVLHYFILAQALWWTLLALSWYLESGLRWSSEAIGEQAHLLHLIGWSLPALPVIVLLATERVEGDPLLGICFFGFINKDALKVFLFWPLAVCLVIGITLIAATLIELRRIRRVIKQELAQTTKLEQLTVRIVLHSVLHCLPQLALLYCVQFEVRTFPRWIHLWLDHICRKSEYALPCPPVSNSLDYTVDHAQQAFLLSIIKYVCLQVGSVTSAVWMMSNKTITSWNLFCTNFRLNHLIRNVHAPKINTSQDYKFSVHKPSNSSITQDMYI